MKKILWRYEAPEIFLLSRELSSVLCVSARFEDFEEGSVIDPFDDQGL